MPCILALISVGVQGLKLCQHVASMQNSYSLLQTLLLWDVLFSYKMTKKQIGEMTHQIQ